MRGFVPPRALMTGRMVGLLACVPQDSGVGVPQHDRARDAESVAGCLGGERNLGKLLGHPAHGAAVVQQHADGDVVTGRTIVHPAPEELHVARLTGLVAHDVDDPTALLFVP